MSIHTHSPALTAPELCRPTPMRLAPAARALWRVIDHTGLVVGHLQSVADTRGTRYRARRFHPDSRVFRDLGDFWSADDALECLRYAR